MLDEDYYEYHWRADSTMTSQLGRRLLDHPKVQLELLEDLLSRSEEYKKYHEEIEYYFIKSFYIETLVFAYANGGMITPEFMSYMQSVCKIFFPNASENKYIKSDAVFAETVDSLDMEFDDIKKLDAFEKELAKKLL